MRARVSRMVAGFFCAVLGLLTADVLGAATGQPGSVPRPVGEAVTSYCASGKAQRPSGEGVPNVTITFTLRSGTGSVPGPVTTGADGSFSQCGFADGAVYRATPSKPVWRFDPPYWEFSREIANIVFTGLAPFDTSGDIVDPAGHGCVGITVSFSLVAGEAEVPTPVQTDSTGRFTQLGFKNGATFRATPSMPNWGFVPASLDFTVEDASTPLRFTGLPPFSVSGIVRDINGKGVGGATVSFIRRSGSGQTPVSVTSGEDGGWSQSGFQTGSSYRVQVSKELWSFLPTYIDFNGPRSDLDFVGKPPFCVSVTVKDTSGNPVEGVRITFSLISGSGPTPPSGDTDKDGVFRQCGFRAGSQFKVQTSKEGWSFLPLHYIVSDESELLFTGKGPFSVSGRVVDASEQGAGDVTITFTRVGSSGSLPPAVKTLADGTFSQQGFTPTVTYRAAATKMGWSFLPGYIEFSSETSGMRFVGTPPYCVSGGVIDGSGNGVSGVRISFQLRSQSGVTPSQVLTDEKGSWSQCGFTGGSAYRVSASFVGWVFQPLFYDFDGPAENLIFLGTGPYPVSGKVIDAFGQGVPAVTITFQLTSGSGITPAPTLTDPLGKWSQTGFSAGCTYRATPSKSGWSFAPANWVFSGPRNDLDFTGTGPFSASGRVVDDSGQALVDVKIVFSRRSGTGSIPLSAKTDPNGYWSQSGFASGSTYRATPEFPGWVFVPPYREFAAEALDVNFTGSGPYSASGRVVTASTGNSLPGVTIAFTCLSGTGLPPSPVLTDEKGIWKQDGFAAGVTYRATPSNSGWTFLPTHRDFGAKAVGQDFTAVPPYETGGTVVDESGDGVEGVKVIFWRETGGGFLPGFVFTGPGGDWTQTGFSEGTCYRVTFEKQGWVFTPSEMEFCGPDEGLDTQALGPYGVSGKVVDASGKGIAGVKISFSVRTGTGRIPQAVVTAADGTWSQEGFDRGCTYWAEPSLDAWSFSPSRLQFSGPRGDLDFMANAPYGVSGHVVDTAGQAVQGVTVAFSLVSGTGAAPDAVTSDSKGFFTQSGFRWDCSYKAVPDKIGWCFLPEYAVVNNSSSQLTFTGKSPYTVSGRVTLASGEGVGDVLISFSLMSGCGKPPPPATVTTEPGGKFTQSGFWGGTTYRATPRLTGWTFTPAWRDFNSATQNLDFTAQGPKAVLVVASEYGSPVPPRGKTEFPKGETVNASVEQQVSGGAGTRYLCTGWTGTGSTPATGQASSVSFVIQQDSSLTWSWKTEFLLRTLSSPGGAVTPSGDRWYEKGTKVLVSASAQPTYIFTGWSGGATGKARTIAVTMDAPKTLYASFSLDSDLDGLPDDWERDHFGDISRDADDDPDGDQLPNIIEYYFGTDPNDSSTPKLTVHLTACGIDVATKFPTIINRVSVLDGEERYVTGLTAADFVVWEDGVPQMPIEVLERGGGACAAVALVLDNSGSMAGLPLENSHTAANLFIDQLQQCDTGAVIKFGRDISVAQPLTSDENLLHGAVNGGFDGDPGGTVFYDAIYRALHELISGVGSKAIVALTDGKDTSSGHTIEQVIQYAQLLKAPIYVVGLGDVNEEDLRLLAKSTGGQYYHTADSSDLQDIYRRVSQIVANWYDVTYQTSNADPNAPPFPRTVTVWAHSDGAVGRDDGTYEPPRSTAENDPPICHVETPEGVKSGDVTVNYQLLDRESDICSIGVFYSLDSGNSWSVAAVAATSPTKELQSSPGGVAHTVVWMSDNDIPHRDEDRVRIKIVPYDPHQEGVPDQTKDFSVHNNKRPSVQVDTPIGEQSGDVNVAYSLLDPDSDLCSIAAFFSSNCGREWHPATLSPNTQVKSLSSSPTGVRHTVTWVSATDLPGVDSDTVRVRIVPYDAYEGAPGETSDFRLRNNKRPIAIVATPQGVQSGDVPISYRLVDAEGDICTIAIGFSEDSGDTWKPATKAEGGDPTAGLSSSPQGHPHVYVWDSFADLGYTTQSDIRVKITPSDAKLGISGETDDFTVSNVRPPRLSYSPGSFDFSAIENSGDPPAQELQIWNSGGGMLNWKAETDSGWLTLSETEGNSEGEKDTVPVMVHVTNLRPGAYRGNIVLSSSNVSGGPWFIPVLLQIYPVEVSVSPLEMTFRARRGGPTINPPDQKFTITNTGTKDVGWSIQKAASWVSVSAAAGTVRRGTTSEIAVSIIKAGLNLGTYEADLALSFPGTGFLERKVHVTLHIVPIWVSKAYPLRGDYPTITEAIEAALGLDVIMVEHGTYPEKLWMKDDIEVIGSGADTTTIDAEGKGTVVSFQGIGSCLLKGFTITGGTGERHFQHPHTVGGGIYCLSSSPTISECAIVGNSAVWGGGICVDSGSYPRIENCTFSGNSATDGGAVFCYEGTQPVFETSTLFDNEALWHGGGACCYSKPLFAGCEFARNRAGSSYGGGGIYSKAECIMRVLNCTVAENSCPGAGEGIETEEGSSIEIANSIVWGNGSTDAVLRGVSSVRYCDIRDTTFQGQNGNFSVDPLFFNPGKGDYHLLPKSPCIDRGLNGLVDVPEKDIDGDLRTVGTVIDIGADEHDPEALFLNIDGHEQSDGGLVTIHYTIWNALSRPCSVSTEYSADDGCSWRHATRAEGSEPTIERSSSPEGQSHTYAWDSIPDVGAGGSFRFKMVPVAGTRSYFVPTEPFSVDNSTVDSDGDKLPDAWERRYFGDLTRAGDGDFDGDGQSNLREYLQETNPADATSSLILTCEQGEAGTFLLSWLSSAGKYYVLYCCERMGDPWHPLGSAFMGSGSLLQYRDNTVSGATRQRFYLLETY